MDLVKANSVREIHKGGAPTPHRTSISEKPTFCQEPTVTELPGALPEGSGAAGVSRCLGTAGAGDTEQQLPSSVAYDGQLRRN